MGFSTSANIGVLHSEQFAWDGKQLASRLASLLVQLLNRPDTETEVAQWIASVYNKKRGTMERSYNQFCPVAMAAEVLCSRWTIVLLRELLAGSTRFNDLRRGLPRMSPALLSQRLKELEETGVIKRRRVAGESGIHEYALTEAGRELQPLVESFGKWGQRWIPSKLSLDQLDAQLLMWDMRRGLRFEPPPERRIVIQFQYPDARPRERSWWLILEPRQPVDLCSIDPGHDVDLYVTSPLRTMTAIWMGIETVRQAQAGGQLMLTGDRDLTDTMERWLGLSPFAVEQRRVA
jgi:DNA-binding HxlR family transcriptional regulator